MLAGCGPWRACPEAGKAGRPSDKCGAGSVAEQQQQQQAHHAKCPCAAHICTPPPPSCPHSALTPVVLSDPHCTITIQYCTFNSGILSDRFIKAIRTIDFVVRGCYRSFQAGNIFHKHFDILRMPNSSHNEGIGAGRFLGLISGPN